MEVLTDISFCHIKNIEVYGEMLYTQEMKQRMYIERYVCGESSKLTIGANSKSSFLNFIVANISDDAGKLKSTE